MKIYRYISIYMQIDVYMNFSSSLSVYLYPYGYIFVHVCIYMIVCAEDDLFPRSQKAILWDVTRTES